MKHLEIFHGLIAEGMKMRYGSKPGKAALLRVLWEKKHIMDAGYIDYYLMAFWLFRHYADSSGIGFRARGAVPSSIVCYCLGVTEVDPIKYGLHSVSFVNDRLPLFQFDIEASRFDEFMKGAEEMLQANAGDYDISAMKACVLREDVKIGKRMRKMYLTPCEYLSRKHERPVPENIDDELARYALSFPQTQPFSATYFSRKNGAAWSLTGVASLDEILAPTYGLLIYQEQRHDILKEFFDYSPIEGNKIRIAIHRGDTELLAAYRADLHNHLKDRTPEECDTAWAVLVSNPKAFLKAHAVSHVLAKYKFETDPKW